MLKSIEPGTTAPHHGQPAPAQPAASVPTETYPPPYPTAEEVMSDIARTIISALALSLVANMLLLAFGL